MGKLYRFLIQEGVIRDIDEELFSNCISHAHINELWENAKPLRKRNVLQRLFKTISNYYPEDWIKKCSKNLNKEVRHITNPTDSKTISDFTLKLGKVMNGK